MREIKAFIREKRTNEKSKHFGMPVSPSLTISKAKGIGKYIKKDDMPSFWFPVTHCKMSKPEIVCKKEDVEASVKVIHEHGGTGEKGDGLIYMSEESKIYKVRTGK